MENDRILREHLLSLTKGGNAHAKFDEAVKGFPVSHINTKFKDSPYTFWELLEHIRITQWDILDFIRNPNYKYMKWPKDHWPDKGKKATKKDWDNTIALFNKDSKELQSIIKNPKIDIYGKIKQGTGQTVLREILLVADHNAYHIGELVVMRRFIGIWKK